MTTPREQAVQFFNTAVGVQVADPSHAYRLYTSSVMVDPTFLEGWIEVSNANGNLGLNAAAAAAARRAVDLAPDNPHALANLGHRLYRLARNKEARYWTEKALAIDPDHVWALMSMSLIQTTDGEMAESVLSASRAYALDQSPIMEFALAIALLNNEQWAEGLKHFESKFQYRLQQYQNYLNFPYPMWKGEDLTDKTLLIVAEQGLGDTMSFLRFVYPLAEKHLPDFYAPAASYKSIALQVQPELVSFVAPMFSRYRSIEVGPLTQLLPQADYWLSITSLPFALGMTDKQIEIASGSSVPYTSLAATVPWKTPGKKLHVGIAWAGSPQSDIDRWRSFTLTDMLPLADVPGIQLYGLQVGPRANDIHPIGAQALVKDLSPYIRSFADTASVVRDLDLVVTVESSLRHLCGLLKVECLVPYAYYGEGDYRCGRKREHPLWDDKTTLYRQGPDGTWAPVFERIVEDLKRRVG